MDFYIYILRSPTFDKFYVGHSENPWRRLQEHNTGIHHKFTSDFRPWVLEAVFRVGEDRSAAMKIELFIKKQKSKKLIQKLTDPDFVPTDSLAQLLRVPHLRD